MKTKKQVLAEFQLIQKQLFADKRIESVTLRAYNDDDGEFWNIEIRVSHWDDATEKHDLWESVEWNHYTYHTEEKEQKNQRNLAEFKEKFNLK